MTGYSSQVKIKLIFNNLMKTLLSQSTIGNISIQNKIGLAAMTRCRCDNDSGVPN